MYGADAEDAGDCDSLFRLEAQCDLLPIKRKRVFHAPRFQTWARAYPCTYARSPAPYGVFNSETISVMCVLRVSV